MKSRTLLIFWLYMIPFFGSSQENCFYNSIIQPPDIWNVSTGSGANNYPKKIVPFKDKFLLASVFNTRDSTGRIIDHCVYISMDNCGNEIYHSSHPSHHIYQGKKQSNIHYAIENKDSILVCYSNPNFMAYWMNEELAPRLAFTLDSFPYNIQKVNILQDSLVLIHYTSLQSSALGLYNFQGKLKQTLLQTPFSQGTGFSLQQVSIVGNTICGYGNLTNDSTQLYVIQLNTNLDVIQERLIPLPNQLKIHPKNHAFCLSKQDSNMLQMAFINAGKSDVYSINLFNQTSTKLGTIQHPYSNIEEMREFLEVDSYYGLTTSKEFYVTNKQLKLVSLIPYSFDSTIQSAGNNARGYGWRFESNLLLHSSLGAKIATGGGYNYWGINSSHAYVSYSVRNIKVSNYTPIQITLSDTFYNTSSIIHARVNTPQASSLDASISGKWFLSKKLSTTDQNPHIIGIIFPSQQPPNSIDSVNVCFQYYYNGSSPIDTCKKLYLVNGKINSAKIIEESKVKYPACHIFPNPAQDNLYIQATGSLLINSIEILDLEGRTILKSEFGSETNVQMVISQLGSGCYFILVNGYPKAYKFIKQ